MDTLDVESAVRSRYSDASSTCVADLGSDGGKICFILGQRVGETGRVIGVDPTPARVSTTDESCDPTTECC